MQGFIPNFIDQQIALSNHHGQVNAVIIFADLQGFTSYTEKLLSKGNAGAELLSQMLNEVFCAASISIHTRDGFIPYFAGDAFTGVFISTSGAQQAIFAAQDIRRKLLDLAIDIPLRIGLGTGSLEWHITKEQPYKWYIRGEGMADAVSAEQHAGPNEICISQAVANLTPTISKEVLTESGYFRLIPQAPSDIPNVKPISTPSAPFFYPEFLRDRFHSGEFRAVTSLFISIQGDTNTTALDNFLVFSCAEIERRGGYFKELDFTDKGGLFVAFFGAPVNMGDSHQAAIDTAFIIRDHFAKSTLLLRIGIASGQAFCGTAGDDYRRQYIVAGRSINLAARIALKADIGEIRADELTASLPSLIKDDLGMIHAKGFTAPVQIFALQSFKVRLDKDDRYYRPKEFLLPFRDHFLSSPGTCLEITGEPGVGKSFTARKLTKLLESNYYWLKVDAHQMRTAPFEDLEMAWRSTVALSTNDLLKINLERLERIRSNADLPVKERFDQIRSIHDELLRQSHLNVPVAIWIEHWPDLDYASRELLIALANQLVIHILVTTREPLAELKALHSGKHRLLQLPPLSDAGMTQLATCVLNQDPDPHLVDSIQKAANGNPFYAEQFLYYLQSKNLIITNEQGLAITSEKDIKLGGTLRDILLARLDQMDTLVREMLTFAAVIGQYFDTILLFELLKLVPGAIVGAEKILKQAEAAEIIHVNKDNLYYFQHSLLREVILEVQMHSKLRHFHKLVVETMEALYKGSLEIYAVELAIHSQEAGLQNQAATYYQMAGRYAMSQYQNREALDFFDNARLLTTNPLDKIPIILDGIPARVALGQWELAFQELEDPLFNEKISPLLQAKHLALKGHILTLSGKYSEATSVLNLSFEAFRSLNNNEGMAGCTRDLSVLHFRKGEYVLAENYITQTFERLPADHQKDSGLVMNLSLIRMNQGRYQEAEQLIYNELMIRHQTGENQSLISLYINLGVIQNEMGKYQEALSNLEKGFTLAETYSNKLWMSIALGTRGLALQNTGDWAKAIEDFKTDLALARELGDPQGESIALELLGSLEIKLGHWSQGEELLLKALSISRAMGYKKGIIKSLLGLVQSSCWQEDFDLSIKYATEALEMAAEIGNRKLLATATLELSSLFIEVMDLSQARKYLALAEPDVILWEDPILIGQLKRLRMHVLSGREKEDALESALSDPSDIWTQAEANYLIWISNKDLHARNLAYDLFQKAQIKTPHILFSHRIKQLS
ncbi:MAG: tetratricopeptide repeat protein [Saprospiraceae bacterium]|nr:tetratricopeptide repeat protein [Saprospiraceae bacterium]